LSSVMVILVIGMTRTIYTEVEVIRSPQP